MSASIINRLVRSDVRTASTGALILGVVLAAFACNTSEPDKTDDSDEAIGERQQSVEVCAAGPTTFGIDVSRYQGDIDWAQVAGADVKFAYIQISRKIDDIDAKFEFNWAQAKAVGILRGAYQRFQPDQDVLGQADIFLNKLGPIQAGDLPPMLDVEDSGGLPAATIAERVRQWLVYVEAATGLRPIIYTGRYFWQDQLAGADFTEYPLWIAHYTTGCPNIPTPWTGWALHQYSSQAVLPGITTNTVDVNHFNGSIDDLVALTAKDECGDGMCSDGGVDADASSQPDAGDDAGPGGNNGNDSDGSGCGCRVAGSSDGNSWVLLLGLGFFLLTTQRRRRRG